MKKILLSLSIISYCGYAHATGECGALNVTIVNKAKIPLMIKLSEVDSAANYGVNDVNHDAEIFSAAQSGGYIFLNTANKENALSDSIPTSRTIVLADPAMFDGPSIRIQAFWEYHAYLKYKYPLLCNQNLENYSLCNPNPFADNLRLTTLYDFTVHRNPTFLEAGNVYVKSHVATESTVYNSTNKSSAFSTHPTTVNGSCEDNKSASAVIELNDADSY